MPLPAQREEGSGVPRAVPSLTHPLPSALHIGLHDSAFCSCPSLRCYSLFMLE